jgi:hypothetical protein
MVCLQSPTGNYPLNGNGLPVMPANAGIHDFGRHHRAGVKSWMTGTSPVMTMFRRPLI